MDEQKTIPVDITQISRGELQTPPTATDFNGYKVTEWKDGKGTPLNAQNLNKIEAGIEELNHYLQEFKGQYNNYTTATKTKVDTDLNALVKKLNEVITYLNLSMDVIGDGFSTENTITKTVTDNKNKVEGLENSKADKAITLEGYGITDAYTKTYIDNQLSELVGDSADGASKDTIKGAKAYADAAVNSVETEIIGDSTNDGAGASTIAGAKKYADEVVNSTKDVLTTTIDGVSTRVSTIESDYLKSTDKSSLKKDIDDALSEAKKYADENDANTVYDDTQVKTDIKTNSNNITKINGTVTTLQGTVGGLQNQILSFGSELATIKDDIEDLQDIAEGSISFDVLPAVTTDETYATLNEEVVVLDGEGAPI